MGGAHSREQGGDGCQGASNSPEPSITGGPGTLTAGKGGGGLCSTSHPNVLPPPSMCRDAPAQSPGIAGTSRKGGARLLLSLRLPSPGIRGH